MKVVKAIFLPYVLRNLASPWDHIFQEPNLLASENLSSTHNQIREGTDSAFMEDASYCYHLFLMPSIALGTLLFLRAKIYQVMIGFLPLAAENLTCRRFE